jgi:hypothetical protein
MISKRASKASRSGFVVSLARLASSLRVILLIPAFYGLYGLYTRKMPLVKYDTFAILGTSSSCRRARQVTGTA